MADTFQLEIATPDRLIAREQVTEAEIPAANGEIGVLPGHAPLIAQLGVGPLRYVAADGKHLLVVGNGWVEVRDDHVRVLADRAELSTEVDVQRAEAARKRAQDRLSGPASEGVDISRALAALQRAEARLAAAGRKVE